MKTLTILATDKNLYTADYDNEIAENIYAKDINEAVNKSLLIWGLDKYDVIIDFTHNEFDVEYNNDLDGYVLIFNSGNVAHTKFETETNRLDANFSGKYLVSYSEYDSELSNEEEKLFNEFLTVFEFITNVE